MVLACLLPVFSVMAQDSSSTAEPMALPDLDGRTVTVAIENAYRPFNYIDTVSGEAIGWDYDVINEMCARLNCVPEFIQVSWEGMIVAVAGGEYDMAGDGISITEERAKQVDYSMPYITTIQRFIVQIDDTRYETAQALIDDPEAQIATQLATTNYEVAVKLVGEDRIIGMSDFPGAVQSLIAGDVDAVLIDDVAGQGYVGANASAVKVIPDELASDPLGFIYPKGSDLVAPFDAALTSMMVDQSLARISAFWGLGGPVDDIGTTIMLQATDEMNPEFTILFAAAQAASLTGPLMDQAMSLTVFAPTDAAFAALPEGTVEMLLTDPELLGRILQYHVVPTAMLSSEIVSGDVTTLEGSTVTVVVDEEGAVTINGANVILANAKATNGVIHVIDTVLLPPDVAEMMAPVATEAP